MTAIYKIMEDTGINHYLMEFLKEKGLYEEYKEFLIRRKTEDIRDIHGRITEKERQYLRDHGDEISEGMKKSLGVE